MFLQSEGHDVVVTSDGQDCIDVYGKEIAKDSNHRFDIVLLDCKLPTKNVIDDTIIREYPEDEEIVREWR